MWYPYDYEYFGVVYFGLVRFELQHHQLAEFREKNICFCDFVLFEQHSHLVSGSKGCFANTHEAFPYYFERRVDVKFVTVGRLISSNFEEDFSCNGHADGFWV